jgi:hypothetical protein
MAPFATLFRHRLEAVKMRYAIPFVTMLAACSNSAAPSCPGMAPTTALSEGYCTAGEGDRCYYHPKAIDGF